MFTSCICCRGTAALAAPPSTAAACSTSGGGFAAAALEPASDSTCCMSTSSMSLPWATSDLVFSSAPDCVWDTTASWLVFESCAGAGAGRASTGDSVRCRFGDGISRSCASILQDRDNHVHTMLAPKFRSLRHVESQARNLSRIDIMQAPQAGGAWSAKNQLM